MQDVTTAGFAHDQFSAARDAFEANFADGEELGASFCATIEGETVIDLWGGYADEAGLRRWTRDTIVNVYSITKTMTALTALWLADRGELDFAAPVARYWPEFAANGKDRITVAQLMSHTSGLSGWHPAISGEDFYDWDKATSPLAAQAPLWEPGTASGYHVYTFGFLIGEVVRRITGKTLGTVFREQIASPLNADFWIGLPESEDHRVADLVAFLPSSAADGVEMTEIQKITFSDTRTDVPSTRTRAWRGAEIPAVNGHGNARSIAAIQTVLANGGRRWQADHVGSRQPPCAGRPGRRARSRDARHRRALWSRLRPAVSDPGARAAEPQHAVLVRWRRLVRACRYRRTNDFCIRDEPDAAGSRGRRAFVPDHPRDLAGDGDVRQSRLIGDRRHGADRAALCRGRIPLRQLPDIGIQMVPGLAA